MTDLIGKSDVRSENSPMKLEAPSSVGAPLFLYQDAGQAGDLGLDTAKAPVLEVAQVFHDVVLDVAHFGKEKGKVRLGGERGFAAPEEAIGTVVDLATHDGQGWLVTVADSWGCSLQQDDRELSLEELVQAGRAEAQDIGIYRVRLPEGARLSLSLGEVSFVLREVVPGRKVAGKTGQVDLPFLGLMSFVGFMAAMLGVVIATSPPPMDGGVVEIPDRFVELVLTQPPPEAPVAKVLKKQGKDDPGRKAKGKEGKRGEKEAKMKTAKGEAMAKQQRDMDIVADAGLMGVFQDEGALAGVFGSSALNADIAAGVGGLIGAKGTQIGSNGLGSRGGAFGGGGDAEGMGGIDTFGRGGGCDGCGSDGGTFGIKKDGTVAAVGEPILLGGMDKSLIDAVIKRHMNQIKHCYQKELTKSPSLSGKVSVSFVIAPDGSVSKSKIKSSSLGNKTAESCIAGRFMTFQFPEVQGGGIVMVTYPFMFTQG